MAETEKKQLNIYLSADMTGTKASGVSIEQGIKTALSEFNRQQLDFNLEVKVLNHRGSTPRAKKHLQQYLKDPNALVLFSGLHSPPLLAHREFINLNKILVLDPWAAAGPITRFPAEENWIFRLSVDDSKAGYVITEYATSQKAVKQPALMLEQTGWGKSNIKTMTSALKTKQLTPQIVKWFNWGLSLNNARIMLREIKQSGADAIFLVANAPEGKAIAKAMASLPNNQRLPIYSHWGITGGDFPEVIAPKTRDKIELSFIQTSFSFLGKLSKFQQETLDRASVLYPQQIKQANDIKAPTGFIHAYDLTRILVAALTQAKPKGDILSKRNSVRIALENLQKPVQGLIKEYKKPFSVFSHSNQDAHEALGINDYRMARYGNNNEIILNQEDKQ